VWECSEGFWELLEGAGDELEIEGILEVVDEECFGR